MAAQPPAVTPPQEEGLAARLGAKVRKWKDQHAAAIKERDAEKARADAAEAKAKDLEARPPDAAATELAELKRTIRDGKHRAAFEDAAKLAAGGELSKTQLDDLWKLSGYEVASEEPDPKAIAGVIAAQKAERSYLLTPAAGSGQQTGAKPGPGTGRGNPDAQNQGIFEITKAQANDPLFMRDNAKKIWQAQLEGRFQIADQSPLVR